MEDLQFKLDRYNRKNQFFESKKTQWLELDTVTFLHLIFNRDTDEDPRLLPFEDTWCERVYSPWNDLDKLMREKHIPLFALESLDPIKDFDFIGFNTQIEEFGRKHCISQHKIYNIQSYIEEMCVQIILPQLPSALPDTAHTKNRYPVYYHLHQRCHHYRRYRR